MLISEKNNDDNNRAAQVKLYSFDQIEGECMKSEVGNKAYMLSQLKSAGFSVPEGYCVPYSVFEIYSRTNEILTGVVDQIINIKQLLGGKVAIRSSANVEDSDNLTMAGVFESYFVFHDNEVLSAIEKIYAQSRSAEVADYLMLYGMSQEQLKMSLVVQKLVEADYSGVVYTGVNEDYILVQYFDGYRSTLLDEGTDKGTSIIINGIGELVESKAFDRRPLPKAVLRQIYQLGIRILSFV
ncbi:hypothetical protein FHR92_005195 [Fontibacillus solani]|uniref:Pyruvate phosphate dikinase AMP/ATP-binding domain-containing protein n=1 Tax=Fontibacillus solani TaxID=1572857 RepID=A0A7W3SYP8_9BACL|nr:PEP/pyruvate-binding domain-containing protein [Fontibacillus solani]MBA9088677.1 hypothetical protein [Fontibacillus solani]